MYQIIGVDIRGIECNTHAKLYQLKLNDVDCQVNCYALIGINFNIQFDVLRIIIYIMLNNI